MNNRKKSDQAEAVETMTSACKIYQKLLMEPPVKSKRPVGGGVGVAFNKDLVVPAVLAPIGKTDSYDEHISDLKRAKSACELGLVLSPLSNQTSGMFYTTPENFPGQLQEAKHRAEKAIEKTWFPRFGMSSE